MCPKVPSYLSHVFSYFYFYFLRLKYYYIIITSLLSLKSSHMCNSLFSFKLMFFCINWYCVYVHSMHAYFCVYYMENYICIHTQGVNRYIVYVHIHKCILIGTCLLIYQYIFLNMYYYTHILFLKQPAKSTRCNFFYFSLLFYWVIQFLCIFKL